MFDAIGGGVLAAQTVARWSGRALDPAITAIFADAPGELLNQSNPDDLWSAVVDAEPEPRRTFRDENALDEALAGFGDAADLKSPWFTGHSRGVPWLATAALHRSDAARTLSGLPLDRDAVRAVLHAAGAPPAALPPLPAGLTERELDILRLLAAGRTKREIAADLVISQSTVHTHTVHIYAKCGVSTRAALAMFAMRHGLASRADRKID